jgi:hypothetical protein
LISLGCPKNLVDSEVMLGLAREAGHEITDDAAAAEVLVVNTCAFIDSAKQESVDAILEMARHKEGGACQRLIVTGCLAERYRDELRAEVPEIDATKNQSEQPQHPRLPPLTRRGFARGHHLREHADAGERQREQHETAGPRFAAPLSLLGCWLLHSATEPFARPRGDTSSSANNSPVRRPLTPSLSPSDGERVAEDQVRGCSERHTSC